VQLKVWRDGAARNMTAKLDEMEATRVASAGSGAGGSSRLGLSVRPLTPDEQRQVDTTGGLLVQDSTGPAAAAGIQPGDIVLSADGSAVTSADQLRDLAAKAKHPIALLVQRDGARIFVPVDVG
jgi:serine protease Do